MGLVRAASAWMGSVLIHGWLVWQASSAFSPPVSASPRVDRWGGNTFDVEISLEGNTSSTRGETSAPGTTTAQAQTTARSPSSSDDSPSAPSPSGPIPNASPTTETANAPSTPPAQDSDALAAEPAARRPSAVARDMQAVPSVTPSSPSASHGFPADPSATASSPSATATESRPSGATYGAAGLKAGVRDLSSAVTRAIPPAAASQSAWRSLAVGEVGSFRLRLRLDETGRIESSNVLEERERPTPPEFLALSRRIVGLLGGGQFALPHRPGDALVQTLHITVHLEERPPRPEAQPTETVQLGFEPPSAGRAGKAFFTLGSGRHFEALVRIVPDG